jgi:hypothetical protein
MLPRRLQANAVVFSYKPQTKILLPPGIQALLGNYILLHKGSVANAFVDAMHWDWQGLNTLIF